MERKHRRLLETARGLHFQAKLPDKFWGDSVLCATYLINRMPLKCLSLQTPYFKLFQDHAEISHLKAYGCLCYVSTYKVLRTKFDPRAQASVFLGYSNTTKGYKVFNLKTNSISISNLMISRVICFLILSSTDLS